MEAIVLAGGLGIRLQGIVPDLPKPMAPISGRPFLEILLTMLSGKGFGRVVLALGHMSTTIVEYFGNRFAGMELAYEIEPLPLGTGGAVRRAMGRCDSDHTFVLNGDTYLDLEAGDIEAQWQRQRCPILVAREVPDTSRYGRLSVDNGSVVGFAEKDRGGRGLINAGCYVFSRDIVDRLPGVEAFSLENDFLAKHASVLALKIFISRGRFIDIGIPEDYLRAQQDLAGVCR